MRPAYLILLSTGAFLLGTSDGTTVELACRRDPHLPVCQLSYTSDSRLRLKRSNDSDKRHRQELIDRKFEADSFQRYCLFLAMVQQLNVKLRTCLKERVHGHSKQAACEVVAEDHREVCLDRPKNTLNESEKQFCEAFNNICLPFQSEPTRSNIIHPPPGQPGNESGSRPMRNFTEFCSEFKQRYLFVCPDPLRFGKKAIVFCPLYAEKCNVPLPEKPVVPTRRTRRPNARTAIARLCVENRQFALSYCHNPVLLQQPTYRDICLKYRYFCTRPHSV